MSSMTASPTHGHTPLAAASSAVAPEGPAMWSGRKRPVDPEETGSLSTAAPYDSELAGPSSKRPRTIDDLGSMLSLRPPDPPGNFGSKRKSGDNNMDTEDDRSAKHPRPAGALSSTVDDGAASSTAAGQRSQEPEGRKGGSPTNVASLHPPRAPSQQSTSYEYARQDSFRDNSTSDSNNNDGNPNNDNTMAIDDSDHESDSSVSEGSIKKAMYQLVFGRRDPRPSLNANGGRYDAVDSKIEDLIRRSRLQAAVKSQKGEKEDSTMDIDMVEDNSVKSDELGGGDDWNPGHG